MEDFIEQLDLKLQDVFVKRLELSRVAGENAAQPFGDILACLVSIYSAGYVEISKAEADECFDDLRKVAGEVFELMQRLTDEERASA